MAVRQKFQKALMLLDRGEPDRGEETLREVVVESEHEGDQIALVQGLVCLGNLLHDTQRPSEARPFLERALKEMRQDDVLARELNIARELLNLQD